MLEVWVSSKNLDVMNEVEKLLSSIDAAPVVYTNFLENYTKEDCYAFVEGDDDVLFYNSQFQKCNLTKIKIIVCEGKQKVKQCYEYFNWSRFSKKQIVFLIDKDLSDIIDDPNDFSDENVYKTPMYAIENIIASSENFENTLSALGFYNLRDQQIERLRHDFLVEKETFEEKMLLVMAIIIRWKNMHIKPANYNNVKVKDFCHISDDWHVVFPI